MAGVVPCAGRYPLARVNRRPGVALDDMNLRALALAIAVPAALVTFMDRYPALVTDAAELLHATLSRF